MTFSADEIAPTPETVYELHGIPATVPVPDRVAALYARSLEFFRATVDARGIVAPITKEEFKKVYDGEGRNERESPVADVFPRADHLALFAVTLGPRISVEIGHRFRANDLAVAAMLDSVASVAADRIADVLQHRYKESLKRNMEATLAMIAQRTNRCAAPRCFAVLRYSPGYCGWHVSGQGKLFDYLRPERIGLSLRTSFLMEPLKSVSGVLVAGPREIHEFSASYDFCSRCDTRGCRERIRTLCEEEYVVEP